MHRSILKIAAVLGFSIALLGCGDDDPSPGVDAAPDGEAPDAGDTMVDGAINEKPLCTAPTEFAFESKFVEVLGSQMHYIEEGEGPVVLMLHGNPTSSYLWRNIIGPVAEDYRVLAPDLIGMGRSDKPDLDYTFDTHSQYLRGFIETLGLSDITLVIHDWGSGLGFDYAANNEGNVRGIAFMEAIVEPGAPGSFSDLDPQTAQAFMAWRDPALAPQLLQEENQFLSVFLPQATSCVLPEEAVSAYLEPFPTPESRLPVRVWPSQIPIDGEPAEMVTRVEAYNTWLRGSTIPKLGLSADPGFILPPMAFDFLQASWTNLTVVDIGPGLHFVQERQPEAIANALLQWLSEIGPSENPVRRTHVESLSYATVEGQTMAYLEAGDPADPPVIMLHGIPTSSMVFRDVVPPVAAAGYRVIAPDLLGFGESDKPDAPTYSLADHARRIFALADELGMTDFVLLVHDIGGFVGWEMLA
ncbi:MAG: haloalkane dehalogenase [Myxococcota bacterium]